MGVEYLVCDSVGFATPGPPESAEMATGYFRAVRQIRVGGSLHLAHATKAVTDGDGGRKPVFRGLKPFGSAFWHNSARSTWYACCADETEDASRALIGLDNQKANMGPLLPAVGLSVQFGPGSTTITPGDLSEASDLSAGMALRQRIAAALKGGPLTIVAIADELGAKRDSVEKALRRQTRTFTTVTNTPDGVHRWALLHDKRGVH